ncbi:sensor domain-containing diguanylate cyclase [Candidatus Bipolaricaulota bacterium]|nr:sensor domain-containing diguanylate cyclase [Candidatus Bipolaricaulota bacterium]
MNEKHPEAHDSTYDEPRYRALFENIPIGLYITTPDGRIVDANPALVRMLNYPDKRSLLGTKASDLYLNPSDREEEQTLFDDGHVVWNYETQLRRRDGKEIWVRDTCRAVRDGEGTILSYEGTLQDITEEKLYEEKLVYMARHDPLTGLFNRHTLAEILEREVSRAQRYQHPIGVLMIDVNRFKEVNDRYGHALGDEVLKAVAEVLCRSVRDSDVVVRYVGDEFLVLLIETDGETDVVRERMIQDMAEASRTATLLDLPISLAIGTAHWMPQDGESIEATLIEADRRMYEAKERAAKS